MLDKILLFPYYLSLKIRDRHYSRPGRKVFVPSVPSVCVGNVTVGGTGKTPHVEMILDILQKSERWAGSQLAVLSRGYKRESKGFQQVTLKSSAALVGDEPLQIKKNFPDVTVAVDKNRIAACGYLTDPEKFRNSKASAKCWDKDFPAADYIVLDDAFQYRKLKAARTVVLVDYNRPVFDDMLLPFGNLRDLPKRIGTADILIVSKCPRQIEVEDKIAFAQKLRIKDYNPETHEGVSCTGRRQTVLFTYIEYGDCECVYPTTDPRYNYSQKLIMVTGIAKDTPLRRHLSDKHKIVKRFSFPDHHKFVWSDIDKIQKALRKHPTACIVTTQKDVQRLLDFQGMPDIIKERLLVAPIKTRFTTETEEAMFKDLILTLS